MNYSEFSKDCIRYADALMAEFRVEKFNYLPESARRIFYNMVVRTQNPCKEVPLPAIYDEAAAIFVPISDDLVFEDEIEVDKNGLDKNGRFVW
jgi:hypothetical protein